MDNNQKFEVNKPNSTALVLMNAETEAAKVIRLYEFEAYSFKNSLKKALRSDMPIPYAKIPSYNSMIIEDFRQVLKELYGIDFDFTITPNNEVMEVVN